MTSLVPGSFEASFCRNVCGSSLAKRRASGTPWRPLRNQKAFECFEGCRMTLRMIRSWPLMHQVDPAFLPPAALHQRALFKPR